MLQTIEPRWAGQTVAIVASGPSLTRRDCAYLEGRCPVVAVNDAWRLAPFADVLYACDRKWWDHHAGVPDFPGERWTQNRHALAPPNAALDAAHLAWAEGRGLNVVALIAAAGLSRDPARIHRVGGSSAGQAVNFVALAAAVRIVLLGFDNGGTHFFGEHPGCLRVTSPFADFAAAFADAADDLRQMGVSVVNCSRQTSLTCFERMPLEDAI